MLPPANEAKDLNLTITEPPLKKLKKQIEKMAAASETQSITITELSPASLKVQFQEDARLISGEIIDIDSPRESTLEKWRKSFQSSSISSLNQVINSQSIVEFDLLSDGFFSDPINPKEEKTGVLDQDEFDFGSDAFSDIEDELASFSLSKYESDKPYHRVKIQKIIESFYVSEGKAFRNPQKEIECLLVENDVTRIDVAPLKVLIRGEWLHCKIEEETVVNVIGSIKEGELVIDDEKNYLVIEPDILINTTGIADSFTCLRRAVLSFRNQTSVEDNKPSASLTIGSIVHELVEDAFKNGNFKEIHSNDSKLNFLISKKIKEIFSSEKDENFIKEKVIETLKNFPKWCQLYIRKYPAIHAYVQDQHSNGPSTICISKILDLEENIWSAMFGLKGKIDSTILMKYASKTNSGKSSQYATVLCPFELKTGQMTTSLNHRAQTLLYTLMLNDRYRRTIDYGLLFYITTGDLIRISSYRRDIQSILIKRNLLANHLKRGRNVLSGENVFPACELPAQILNEHLCKKCFQVETCLMYHKLIEGGTCQTSSVPKLFEEKTAHLDKAEYGEFLKKWENLITLEEIETTESRSELWRFASEKRSKRGKCLIGMELISCEEILESRGMNQYICRFVRAEDLNVLETSLLNSYINEGDPIIISFENDQMAQYALATGIVSALTADYIVIYTDRPIKIIMSPEESLEKIEGENCTNNNRQVRFCIDKNELTSSFGLLRANMIKIFSVESRKLHELIVNQRAPKYLPRDRNNFDEFVLREYEKSFQMYRDYQKMDEYQREAFFKSIETLDYSLILGMPGTGKTTTLSFIIRYLVLIMGKSVLISSHTHSAIDHIALKLQEKNLSFLRLGFEEKIDKSIRDEFLLDKKQFKSVSEVEHCYSNARVVICTSFGMNHPIFMRKRFDFCIVDEASQLTLPACIGSLRVSQSFILVGDHFQLPPLVRSKEALKLGYGESLFKILADCHPQAMSKLCHQYRMNEEIMSIANRLTYHNLLKCGSESVRNQFLEISSDPQIPWLKQILTPSFKVAFLNTDRLMNAYEVVNGNSFHNEGEAEIIKLIIKTSISSGIEESQISLISPYRPQLKYLNFSEYKGITVSTIDKFQGKDSDFVIISLVRSNTTRNVGELLKDWQRLNVAFTRAKKKLFLVGSAGTILENPTFKKLADLIRERNWLIEIPSE